MPPQPEVTHTAYRFGLFEVDCRTGELRKQGRQVKLRGRPFDILVLLLSRHGDVITRDELRRELWPADTFVDFDHGLNSGINRLREALGDSAENPRFIETLPRRGYRFIAPILEAGGKGPEGPDRPGGQERLDDQERQGGRDNPDGQERQDAHNAGQAGDGAPPQRVMDSGQIATVSRPAVSLASRVVLVLAGAALAVSVTLAIVYPRYIRKPATASSKMTLAVLPFENLSRDPDQEFFSDGFTEEMISELGKLDPEHLGVIARTTTRLYKDTRKNISQIRQEIGVDYVLEGSIRRAENRVRITAQLVQTSDMTNLWSDSYERDVSDVLTIQSEVALNIARSLALALRHPAGVFASGTSTSAHELYLRGRFFREQATEESTRKAIEFYQRAIAADPQYAPAYAGIADAYSLLGAPGWEVDRPAALLQKAQASAERALAIDPQSAEAHAVLGMVRLNYRWDRDGSEREIQEAIRLNPSFAQAHQYYSTTLTTMGRFDEAIAEARRALELDPLSAPASTTLGIRYYYAGRPREAIAQLLRTVDTNPEFGIAHWGLAQAYRELGDHERELSELQRAVDLSGNSAYMRAHLAYGLAAAGRQQQAEAIRGELRAGGTERYASPYHEALVAAGLNDEKGMMDALERAFADGSGWMVFLPVQPEFARVRQAPAFERLLARVKPTVPSSSSAR